MKKVTTEDVITKFKKVHKDNYIYDLVNYVKATKKVKVLCKEHGIFEITPNSHLNGSGCYFCGRKKINDGKRLSNEEFIEKSNSIHGYKYTYEKTKYLRYLDRVIITCKKHGDFTQQVRKHLLGQGCKKCVSESMYIDFVSMCKEKFEGYSYDKLVYEGMYKEVIITCNIHGDFTSKPINFYHKGQVCKKCINRTNSKPEAEWLDTQGVDESSRNVYINLNGKNYCVDGIDFENKIIYEFYGDFFHGNPDIFNGEEVNPLLKETYGSLYNKTLTKENDIKLSGFNLIKIWENDFKKTKK